MTVTTTRETDDYLNAVREELADLPEEERAELLEDLAQHLADIAADESRAQLPLTDLLGVPADYARELRTAAGLPSKESRRRIKVTRPDLRGWLNRTSLGRWINGPTGQRFMEPVFALARDLRPAWWVARAVIVVIGFFVITSDREWQHMPVPLVAGSRVLGVLALGGAIALSVRLGRRGYGGRRRLIIAADVVVALVALSLVMDASMRLGAFRGSRVVYQSSPSANHVLASPHGPVTNIYPYDAQGNPLENVLLFDQDGRPLRVGKQQWWADRCPREPKYPLAADGVPVEFSYPQRYALVGQRAEFQFGPDGRATTSGPQCMADIPRPAVPLPIFESESPPPPDQGSAPTEQP